MARAVLAANTRLILPLCLGYKEEEKEEEEGKDRERDTHTQGGKD